MVIFYAKISSCTDLEIAKIKKRDVRLLDQNQAIRIQNWIQKCSQSMSKNFADKSIFCVHVRILTLGTLLLCVLPHSGFLATEW